MLGTLGAHFARFLNIAVVPRSLRTPFFVFPFSSGILPARERADVDGAVRGGPRGAGGGAGQCAQGECGLLPHGQGEHRRLLKDGRWKAVLWIVLSIWHAE